MGTIIKADYYPNTDFNHGSISVGVWASERIANNYVVQISNGTGFISTAQVTTNLYLSHICVTP